MSLLVIGAAAALVWANVAPDAYAGIVHATHFVVNDIGMVFFFALAMKEVVHATQKGGALATPRQAGLPVLAAVGGMAVPAVIFAAGAAVLGRSDLSRGWAIPSATDIAFSYLAARVIFHKDSPAIPFLLLLAIADDAMGLLVLAIFYPAGPLAPGTMLLLLGPALTFAWLLRRNRVRHFAAYIAGPGVLAWLALYLGGVHPALALVPIVPFMPAAEGTLERFERAARWPMQLVLFFFGLVNAGVPLSSVGTVTWLVLAALIVGKPLGVVLMTSIAERAGFSRPRGLELRALIVLGVVAGIGFTVALFFATAAFPRGATLENAKMGALLSVAAAPIAIALARAVGIRRS